MININDNYQLLLIQNYHNEKYLNNTLYCMVYYFNEFTIF